MSDNRTILLAKGWRRHTFISISDDVVEEILSDSPETFREYLRGSDVKVLIATYDCAVVHDSFEVEPWVQILVAVPVEFNKQFANGRDSRRIHFYIDAAGDLLPYEVNAKGVYQIDRELLISLDRNENVSLPKDSSYDLKNWLAERYRQDTWPDAFNSAVKPAKERLKRFWKRYEDFISGLYIKPNTFEEIVSGKYQVAIIVCVESYKFRSLIKHLREKNVDLASKELDAVLNTVASEIMSAFGDTLEYVVDPTTKSGRAIEVVGEDSIALTQLRNFSRFSPYSMSSYESDSPLPVEMMPGRSID